MEGSEEEKAYAYSLLQDATVYAYAFFKNKDGDPFRLYPYQDIIANDTHKRIIFAAANQIGKSVTLCIMALHFALNNPGKTVLLTSRGLEQAKDLLREIRRLLRSGSIEYKSQLGDSDNKTELYFKHFEQVEYEGKVEERELQQSRIIVCPATESILGYPVDLALPDELAFYERGRYFFFQMLQPRTYTTKGRIVAFSNPNGQQGVYWELWNSDQFHRYSFNFLDCPTNTQEEYDALQRQLTIEEFDSTVNSIFTSPQGGFISLKEREAMQEERPNMLPVMITKPVSIFFDFGKAYDRTVRTIGVSVGEGEDIGVQVYEMLEYPQGTGYNEIVDDLKELITQIGMENISVIGWDNSGVGKAIQDFIEQVKLLGISCEPVEFSLQNKSRIYTTFKFLIERNLMKGNGVKVPFVTECDKQLGRLRFKKSTRGYLQVHHAEERDRDDYCDSLAGLCSIIVYPETVPVTVKRF